MNMHNKKKTWFCEIIHFQFVKLNYILLSSSIISLLKKERKKREYIYIFKCQWIAAIKDTELMTLTRVISFIVIFPEHHALVFPRCVPGFKCFEKIKQNKKLNKNQIPPPPPKKTNNTHQKTPNPWGLMIQSAVSSVCTSQQWNKLVCTLKSRASTHGVIGPKINPSWKTIELFLVPASARC